MSSSFPQESIERTARHFVRWHPTATARLDRLAQLADFAGHFNPQWKSTNMLHNATTLFAALERHQARYLVIGGFAATIYGVPRFTYDVDLFIENSPKNIAAVLNTLIELGSDLAQITKATGGHLVTILEIDDLPVKTDLLVNVPGLTWEAAWQNRTLQTYQGQQFYTVARADLIRAKRAAGRFQDLEDIKALEATVDETDSDH